MMRLKHWLTLGLLVTTEVTLCSATITQSMLFMLKQGHRVTVRGTAIGQISGPDVTLHVCGMFCGKLDCKLFHYSSVNKICAIFAEAYYAVSLSPDPDWEVGYTPASLVTFQKWTLVFRLQKEIYVPAYQTWMDTGTSNDNPVQNNFPPACLRMFDYGSCDRHFRSHILDNWNGIDKVYLSVIKNDTEVAYIMFNGSGTDMQSWFDKANVIDSTWFSEINDTSLLKTTRIKGICMKQFCRRFLFYGPYVGCPTEWFYIMVQDFVPDLCEKNLKWVPNTAPKAEPAIAYSPASSRASFGVDRDVPLADFADAMAVYVTFT
ncbi:hypothetical protein RRG08_031714 [Elysia crispata]|uniref:Uncharacterized protein n=1 Tax=Elysia crispata TaxID=231223 RepID=A0AAE0ZFD6_9GAST|nr:hypothetical protein RRG08_031714 [Elysia crispata]